MVFFESIMGMPLDRRVHAPLFVQDFICCFRIFSENDREAQDALDETDKKERDTERAEREECLFFVLQCVAELDLFAAADLVNFVKQCG